MKESQFDLTPQSVHMNFVYNMNDSGEVVFHCHKESLLQLKGNDEQYNYLRCSNIDPPGQLRPGFAI